MAFFANPLEEASLIGWCFEVQLFDEQGDKQDRFSTKPADKAVGQLRW